MIHSCVFGFVMVVHESLVCPEQLNFLLVFRKILQVPKMLWFSSIFLCVFEPFPTMPVWFWREVRGVKTFEQNGDVCIFLILPKYLFFFSFSTALQRLQNIVTCFPENKISSIYPDNISFKRLATGSNLETQHISGSENTQCWANPLHVWGCVDMWWEGWARSEADKLVLAR